MSDVPDSLHTQPLLVRLARLRVPLGFAVGVLGIWLARPTWLSLAVGSSVAVAGEAIRIWAAGHLERGVA